MIRVAISLVGAAAALGRAWLLGPRERLEWPERDREPQVPESVTALDAWLAKREGALGDVVEGTEKRIVWHQGAVRTTTIAVVYLHGFSSSRQELAPVPERVAEALNANLFETRLRGHGRPGSALGEVDASEWVVDYQEAIAVGRRLGQKVVVLGCSTGATLDAVISSYWPERSVAAHVWVSPNFGPQDGASGLLTWPWARSWVPLVAGDERQWEPENELQGRFWTTRYPIESLFPMQALVVAAQASPLDRVRAPVLVVHSQDDPVVRPDAIEAAFERLGSETKERAEISGPGDNHVLAGDIMAPAKTSEAVQRIGQFLTQALVEP